MAKFEFTGTVHYGLWAKCTQLWPDKLKVELFKYGITGCEVHGPNYSSQNITLGFKAGTPHGIKEATYPLNNSHGSELI